MFDNFSTHRTNQHRYLSLIALTLLVWNISSSAFAYEDKSSTPLKHKLTVEERRLEKAHNAIPAIQKRFAAFINDAKSKLSSAKTNAQFVSLLESTGEKVWQQGTNAYRQYQDFDDRILYWLRLNITAAVRLMPRFQSLSSAEQKNALWKFELASRGNNDVVFDQNTKYKVLLTGFDPFFLDRDIKQSNPSGAAAQAFDNRVLRIGDKSIEIETLIVPVRFADFDQGMIETMLTPWIKNKKVDAVLTVSMGRDDFDLERFPGRRRSAKAPGNLNVYTGATRENPQLPMLNGKPLQGPEFVLFSLPAEKMQKAAGAFQIHDNHKVTTLTKTFEPQSLIELKDEISVAGSGGGYLSNEISYRSLLIRNRFNPNLMVGHIHTPRYKGFEPQKVEKILAQIQQMIKLAFTD